MFNPLREIFKFYECFANEGEDGIYYLSCEGAFQFPEMMMFGFHCLICILMFLFTTLFALLTFTAIIFLFSLAIFKTCPKAVFDEDEMEEFYKYKELG